jgi:hypothetical protein
MWPFAQSIEVKKERDEMRDQVAQTAVAMRAEIAKLQSALRRKAAEKLERENENDTDLRDQ